MPRFSTAAYRVCAVVLLGYVAVGVLMILGQKSTIHEGGICVIGLRKFAYVHILTLEYSTALISSQDYYFDVLRPVPEYLSHCHVFVALIATIKSP
jgi:hypothetical protein